ncbi:hypothetical protein Sgly_2269 [Syntrophobotulus glycolicus DSM 8271]|uniref:Uncharacterized protein n=1 Tax=Syntrophobotulus glycolicus (strain DSM 8271 / FlGlyR) TaxID=645991 RepID=F0SUA8_SYNGF|nr:hypothetical protein [Syntrophobotulus glycolicus]ADY56558.1 hypothetical protein Sgly_2269 [Syntrophobotulus glycolicus DSM 8271]
MENEYIYRLKPLLVPGVLFILLYPLVFGPLSFYFFLPEIYVKIFTGIYLFTFFSILILWLNGKGKRVIFKDNKLILSSPLRNVVLKPDNISKILFFWTKRQEEIVQIYSGQKRYFLSDLYFPYNELLTDLEDFISQNEIRNNLARHYEAV